MLKQFILALLRFFGFRSTAKVLPAPVPTTQEQVAAVLAEAGFTLKLPVGGRVVAYAPNPKRRERRAWQARQRAAGKPSSARAYRRTAM